MNSMDKAVDFYNVMLAIHKELDRAEVLHPSFPTDQVYRVAIIEEEVGEAMKEAIDIEMKGDMTAFGRLHTELVQTAAMAVRALMELTKEIS